MVYYLIMCRSLTYAQRTVRILERGGISGHLMRAPRSITKEGCAYCVKIAELKLAAALRLLQREGLVPKQVYMQESTGEYSEVVQ